MGWVGSEWGGFCCSEGAGEERVGGLNGGVWNGLERKERRK